MIKKLKAIYMFIKFSLFLMLWSKSYSTLAISNNFFTKYVDIFKIYSDIIDISPAKMPNILQIILMEHFF